jgi:hypothetical protein
MPARPSYQPSLGDLPSSFPSASDPSQVTHLGIKYHGRNADMLYDQIRLEAFTMITLIDFQVETLFMLALAVLAVQLFHWMHSGNDQGRTVSAQDYLYKMARITGASEYEIFRKSAEDWPVSEAMVKEHFKDYLLHQATPCYVNDFVRKNKHRIDELKLPPV